MHVQGFACDQHARPGTVVPKTQTTSAATPIFNVIHRGGLRFGHLTIPNRDLTPTGAEGAGGAAGPGCGARGLRGTWAAAPVGGTDTTAR